VVVSVGAECDAVINVVVIRGAGAAATLHVSVERRRRLTPPAAAAAAAAAAVASSPAAAAAGSAPAQLAAHASAHQQQRESHSCFTGNVLVRGIHTFLWCLVMGGSKANGGGIGERGR